MVRERYGKLSIFDNSNKLIFELNYVYLSRINYTMKWLSGSRKFYNWKTLVFWRDGEKIAIFKR